MQESLRLWQRAQRPGATREEVERAAAAVPELCSALDAALRGAVRRPEADVERLGRYVAHEVRNRLHLVELSVERAAALSGDPRVRSALDPVRRAFGHLAAIADDLRASVLPLASEGAGRAEFPLLPLRSVVADVLAASGDLAEAQDVVLELEGECPDAEVDAARLELVLVNLLTNALRHTDGAKHERWVQVAACWHDPEAEVLELCVRDNGVGISDRRRRKLFDESHRESNGRPPRSGMGLAIVHQAVERAGGRVWIESDEGVGTAVHFTLPASSRRRRPSEPERSEPTPSRSAASP